MSFIIFVSLLILLMAGIYILALKYLNRDWWRNRLIRLLAFSLPVIGLIAALVWWFTPWGSVLWLRSAAMLVAGMVLVFELSLILTFPLASLVRVIGRQVLKLFPAAKRSEAGSSDQVDLARRRVVGRIAAAVPLGTLALGVGGFGRALGEVNVYERPMTIAGLPDDLKGIKIFHMSDLHLGPFVRLQDLEKTLEQAEQYKPDLILVTGDIADDVSILEGALNLIDQLNPRLGSFASLGNHEHFRGVEQIMRIISRSPVRLMVDQSTFVDVGSSSLAVAAIDDPRRMRGDHTRFFNSALDQALAGVRSDDTVVLMSHRPSVFDQAAERGVHLTLSGHTHGGQVGLMGRSLFELAADGAYLWGPYTRGEAQLYTSSGMGHWFPFRLGCPPEAPIITLG